ncbi:nitronate monooxygenase [Alphaproteobacteria bacterium LMG 31809]|uniref:Nitronate monooxygenase n=2 Tax=Govanella unica TaxID=2975056 RepID=A0A9X3TXI5_9PROT|nr:nitronate monooxygenase [Govania unica]
MARTALSAEITSKLRLPAIAAPMFLVSGPEMVLESCKAGIIGSFPANNARTIEQLEDWLIRISETAEQAGLPWAVNLIMHRSYARHEEELALVMKYKPPLVITALGSPKDIVEPIHSYGGLVLADVNSIEFAKKAASTGVDGLVLVSSGAGGHTGQISGFAFVPAVREFFDGIIVLGGAIGTGQAVRAAELLGADFAYLGTRLIGSSESMAEDGYKQMLIDASADDIVLSAALTGVPANWLKASIIAAGLDPKELGEKRAIDFGRPEDADKKKWRDIWSAGHGVGSVQDVEPIKAIIDKMVGEYEACI